MLGQHQSTAHAWRPLAYRPRASTTQKNDRMQTTHKKRPRFPAWIACAALIITLQGCSHTPVYRGIPSSEAAAIVAKLAGTTKPSSTTLGKYYQAEEKKVSWRGYWKCNNQLVVVTMINLVLTAGEGNFVEGTRSVAGDDRCTTVETARMAGRYDDNYVYLYYVDNPTTFINKYEIRKSRYDNGTLAFRGQLKYVDNVWTFHKAQDNPLYGLTGQKIPESGGPADMWESTELQPQTTDPRLTAEQRRRQVANEEGRKAGALAGEIAAREAKDAADQRAANRAANAAAFNAIAQNMAAESARRRAEAAQPRSTLLADSQRAADAARAETERRAEAARQRNAGTPQAYRLPAPTSTSGNVSSGNISSASRTAPAPSSVTNTPSVPARPVVSMPPPRPVAATAPTLGRPPDSAPAPAYTCPSSKWFRSPIRYHDLVTKERTSTFEEACARVGQQVAQFVASIAKGTSSAYGSGSVVKSVDACRKTKNEDDAIVYVHLEEPSSRPCGTPGTGIAR